MAESAESEDDSKENVESEEEEEIENKKIDVIKTPEVMAREYKQMIKDLTASQRQEMIAHVVNYMQPVLEKYVDENPEYGAASQRFGNLRIMNFFWNLIKEDHELITEIEKNDYYGLSDLKKLITAMRDFKPFYNPEVEEFEPWEFEPAQD